MPPSAETDDGNTLSLNNLFYVESTTITIFVTFLVGVFLVFFAVVHPFFKRDSEKYKDCCIFAPQTVLDEHIHT